MRYGLLSSALLFCAASLQLFAGGHGHSKYPIVWERTVEMQQGVSYDEAIQVAGELKAFFKKHDIDITMAVPLSGDTRSITFAMEGDSMDEMMKKSIKVSETKEWKALSEKATKYLSHPVDNWYMVD